MADMHREEKTTKAKKIAFFACRIAEKSYICKMNMI